MKKTAFVSGASRGIGKAIAEALAGEGYHLALTCEKSRETLEKSAQALAKNFHVQVLTFCGDMGDPAFVFSMGKEVLASFSKIDVIVNNAGISHIGLLCDMTAEEWNRILSVNLSSCFYTAKAFVPAMISAKSGRIVNISSMWGDRRSLLRGGLLSLQRRCQQSYPGAGQGAGSQRHLGKRHRLRRCGHGHERVSLLRRADCPGRRNSRRALCHPGRGG